MELIGPKAERVMTLDQLLEAQGVDRELRDVITQECNKRDSQMKTKDGDVRITELYQIKAKLKPIQGITNYKEEFKALLSDKIPTIQSKPHTDGPLLAQIISADRHRDRIQHRNKKYLEEMTDRTMGIFDRLMKHKPDKLIYANLGDYFDSDTPDMKTTKGTQQYSYLPYKESFKLGLKHQIELIKSFAKEIPTEVIIIPGNHDEQKLQALSDALDIYFSKSNVKVDTDITDRRYRQRGKNKIGYAHGHGLKVKQIPNIMQTETKLLNHNTFFLGHNHHRYIHEIGNVMVHQVGSPARLSEREHNQGYKGRGRIEGHLFDKHKGPIYEVLG